MDTDSIKTTFPELVQSLMAGAIKRHALAVRVGRGHLVFLENAYCQLRLSGIYSHRVLCSFSSKLDEADADFDLSLYLFVAFGGEARTIFPPANRDWGDGRRLRHDLERYNDLLVDGRLDGPLNGDYSWANRYADIEAEYMGLSEALDAIYNTGSERKRQEVRDMRHRWNDGDFTWIVDARTAIIPP